MTDRETAPNQPTIRQLVRRSNLLAILCLPVLIWQAWRVNRDVLRVTESRDTSGLAEGPKPPLRLLIMGESTATGVGADSNDKALAGHLARALAALLDRGVHWRVIGQNGYTVTQSRRLFCPRVATDSADLVVIVHGFNDTVDWTSPTTWQKEIGRLVENLNRRLHKAQFVLTGIPPFRHFTSLPEPTRSILALRADALELAADELAETSGMFRHIKLKPLPGAEYYCIDGYHPSARGYALWAEALAEGIAASLL